MRKLSDVSLLFDRSRSLPVVDLSGLYDRSPRIQKLTAQRIGEITQINGFLYLDKHGVSEQLVDDVYTQSRRFFSQDLKEKNNYYIGKSENHRGYVPTTEVGEYADEGQRRYEAFDMGFDKPIPDSHCLKGMPLVGSNVWPELDGFKQTLSKYYEEMRRLEETMCKAFEISLGIPRGYFASHMTRPISQMRLIHYLENDEKPTTEDVNMGAHTDYECFTILHSRSPGLQVMDRQNNWVDAPPIDGTFYFNIGDMLEVWSNGRFKATPHRVQNNGDERYSIPYFAATNFDTIIEPIMAIENGNKKQTEDRKYTPLVAGEHLVSNLLRDFKYLSERHKTGQLKIPSVTRKNNPFEHRIRQATAFA